MSGTVKRPLPHRAVAVAIVAIAAAAAGCAGKPSARATTPLSRPALPVAASSGAQLSDSPPRSESAPSSGNGQSSGNQQRKCTGGQLVASVTDGGAVANQPFAVIALRNRGAACYLDGYPTVAAAYGTASGVRVNVPIHVVDGGNYERSDPEPHHVTLAPGGSASFAMGTETAFDTPIETITALSLTVPGSATTVTVPISIATTPYAGAAQFSVTAFVAGTSGPGLD
ncbi:MAG TPA: DUF4232 domain-containing protein [Micromonosporaceae bacterium]|jgi:hypothetical protein|nr:DUF4232 domain-containing protein [Micromonosporaceae bacterium]